MLYWETVMYCPFMVSATYSSFKREAGTESSMQINSIHINNVLDDNRWDDFEKFLQILVEGYSILGTKIITHSR